jgi:hypothetical protein
VYNTLNLFAEKGLLKPQPLREGVVVFDPHVKPHHHFIDEDTGKVIDVPWEALKVAMRASHVYNRDSPLKRRMPVYAFKRVSCNTSSASSAFLVMTKPNR